MHRVFITGARGFVGGGVVQALRADGHVVRCLVRRGSEPLLKGLGAVERVEGDVLIRRTLDVAVAGCDAVIHLVGIIRERPALAETFERLHVDATLNVLAAASGAGVRRVLHMSALGTRPGARARYHQTKWRAEEAVRSSGLDWTIFRPSIVYGHGDGFVTGLAPMVRRPPVRAGLRGGAARPPPVAPPVVGPGRSRAPAPTRAVGPAGPHPPPAGSGRGWRRCPSGGWRRPSPPPASRCSSRRDGRATCRPRLPTTSRTAPSSTAWSARFSADSRPRCGSASATRRAAASPRPPPAPPPEPRGSWPTRPPWRRACQTTCSAARPCKTSSRP